MSTSRWLQINAAFLMLMGGGAAVADAVGHFFNRGPLAAVMFRAPLAISSFEAHLLALLLGVVLWSGAQRPDRRRLHILAATIHVILGGSNLLFFERAFGSLDMRLFGVVITACHFAFVLVQTLAALQIPRAEAGISARPAQ
jgi:hypothetical protein